MCSCHDSQASHALVQRKNWIKNGERRKQTIRVVATQTPKHAMAHTSRYSPLLTQVSYIDSPQNSTLCSHFPSLSLSLALALQLSIKSQANQALLPHSHHHHCPQTSPNSLAYGIPQPLGMGYPLHSPPVVCSRQGVSAWCNVRRRSWNL